jgi:hypothetical protein
MILIKGRLRNRYKNMMKKLTVFLIKFQTRLIKSKTTCLSPEVLTQIRNTISSIDPIYHHPPSLRERTSLFPLPQGERVKVKAKH